MTGTVTPWSARTSRTAEQAPPARTPSSATTRSPCVRAASKTAFSSTGFTNRMSMRVPFKLSATGASTFVIEPKPRNAIFSPARSVRETPTGIVSASAVTSTPGPRPRG